MRNKLIITTIFSLLFFLMGTAKGWAFSVNGDDYLWLEFNKCVKEEDGSVTLPLRINYGRFPGKTKDVSELDALRAFYTLDEKDNGGNSIFYETGIERDNDKYLVRIKAFKANRFSVLVEGRKIHGESTRYYSAKTSFVLFGHSPFEGKAAKPAVSGGEINSRFEICITPEFSYWPQTCDPVKITLLFNRVCLAGRDISIFDEKEGLTEIRTEESGSYTYIPPEDKELNWAGDTAFRQAVIVAGEEQGNTSCVSSYTLLLHRSRFKNRKGGLGAGIFGGAVAGALLFVGAKRRRLKI